MHFSDNKMTITCSQLQPKANYAGYTEGLGDAEVAQQTTASVLSLTLSIIPAAHMVERQKGLLGVVL